MMLRYWIHAIATSSLWSVLDNKLYYRVMHLQNVNSLNGSCRNLKYFKSTITNSQTFFRFNLKLQQETVTHQKLVHIYCTCI